MSLIELVTDLVGADEMSEDEWSLEECEEAEELVHRVVGLRRKLADLEVRLRRSEKRESDLVTALKAIERLPTPTSGRLDDYPTEVQRLAKEAIEEEIPF